MTPEARFVDLTCRGLRVAQKARLVACAPMVGFLEIDAPLPIGTRVQVIGEGFQVEARVTQVIEQEAGAKSAPGMRLDWGAPTRAVTPPPPVTGDVEAAEEELEAAPSDEGPAPSEEGPAPTDGRRKRRKKTLGGRP